jgi:hypothetical protein
MLVVTRRETDYGRPMDEELQLRCHRCGKRFRTLQECWLCYQPPAVGGRSEATCCHKRCAVGESQVRLLRADVGLQRLLASLLTPAVPLAALKDEPRRISRPWGQP